MYRQALVITLALVAPGQGVLAASSEHHAQSASPSGVTRGSMLAQHMATALNRQTRIEVSGHLDGPGRQSVNYLFRYQASAREYLQESGGIWNQVQVDHQRLQGLRAVSIGKALYSSTDGRHWMRGSRLVAPSALDAISINPAMAPCCVPGKTVSVQVQDAGLRSSRFGKVYALNYRAMSISATIDGTLLVDARTFLPRRYTERCKSMGLTGAFVLTYGGTFNIKSPGR